MKCSIKILLSLALIFLIGSNRNQAITGIAIQHSETTQHLNHHQQQAPIPVLTNRSHVNAPLPEHPEELLFVEETEDDNLHWIQLKNARILSICVSVFFGKADHVQPLYSNTTIPRTVSFSLPPAEILPQLQTFLI